SPLEEGSMPPATIDGRVNLPGRIVISTACGTGSKAFGEAFLKGGAAAYIAPDGYPDGADAALFVHILFHQMLKKGASPDAAFRHAQGYDGVFETFTVSSVCGNIEGNDPRARPETVSSGHE